MAIALEVVSESKKAREDLAKVRESVDSIKRTTQDVSKSFGLMAKSLAAIASAGIALRAYTQISDKLTNLNSRIKLVSDSQSEFNYSFKQLKKIAFETRTDLTTIADLYTKVARSAKDFGASQQDVAKFSNVVAKAIVVSGAGAAQANAAVLQLGQALASGRLGGDELRSILENTPALAKAIADGLHVSVGNLRAMGQEGLLLSRDVFKAILSQTDDINTKFNKMGVTYAQAF